MLESPDERVELAHAEPFEVGQLRVEPQFRIVSNGSSTQVIEPRVMKLLVALARAEGRPLSRDDLIQSCWGGVIVGENAIQRAVSQARNIATGIGEGSFQIDSVRGVGYRLVDSEPVGGPMSGAPPGGGSLSRRSTLALLAVGGAAAAAPFVIGLGSSDGPTKRALELVGRAEVAPRDEDEDSAKQAIALLTDSVRVSPRYAQAWAALALAYWQDLYGIEGTDAEHRAARVRSAALQSLAIAPGSTLARAVLLLLRPNLGRWQQVEQGLEGLAARGDRTWMVPRALADVTQDVGNWAAAIDHFQAALRMENLLPRVHLDLAVAQWGAGRLVDLEHTLAEASRLWPSYYSLWDFRIRYLALSGQYSKAESILMEQATEPVSLASSAVPVRLKLIAALQGKAGRDEVLQSYIARVPLFPLNVTRVSLVLAALDAREELLDLLEGYFLGHGRYAVRPSRYARRPTYFLFLPPMRKLHGEPRLSALMNAIGLKPLA